MPDTELFLSLAEIAGVFVGFGALIALRGSGLNDKYDVLMIGMVVWVAIAVVIIAPFITEAPMRRRWRGELAGGIVSWIPATVALGLVILGVLPEQEAALYFLAAALLLLLPALLLLMAIFHVGFAAFGAPGDGEGPAAPVAPPGLDGGGA